MQVVLLTLLAVGSGAIPRSASAQEFVLVANQANPITELNRADVSKLFLHKRTRWPNGETAVAVDQSEAAPVRRRFSAFVHGMDVPSVKSFWQEVVFSGRGEPPPERTTDEAVLAFVKANPHAVGYVSSVPAGNGVKVITVTP